MRILILGAGALGGYFGARLLAAGRDVTFLVRPARAALLAKTGLHVISPHGGDLHLPPPPTVLTPTEPYDLILLSAKAYDLDSAMDAIAPAVGPATVIIPMLNGLAHLARLDDRFGATRVLGGTCFISATLAPAEAPDPGTIHHLNTRDNFFWGPRPGITAPPTLSQISAQFTGAHFNAAERSDILQDMWEKWTFLSAFAGLTCLFRASIGQIATAGAASTALALFDETIAIATAEGRPPSAAFVAQHRDILTRPGSTMEASMLRDLESGAAIEREQIIGNLLTRAQAHKVSAPILTLANAVLHAYQVRHART